jgi:hypothetical protein
MVHTENPVKCESITALELGKQCPFIDNIPGCHNRAIGKYQVKLENIKFKNEWSKNIDVPLCELPFITTLLTVNIIVIKNITCNKPLL